MIVCALVDRAARSYVLFGGRGKDGLPKESRSARAASLQITFSLDESGRSSFGLLSP